MRVNLELEACLPPERSFKELLSVKEKASTKLNDNSFFHSHLAPPKFAS